MMSHRPDKRGGAPMPPLGSAPVTLDVVGVLVQCSTEDNSTGDGKLESENG